MIDEQIIKLALDLGTTPEAAQKLAESLDKINASGKKAEAEGLAGVEKSALKAESAVYDLAEATDTLSKAAAGNQAREREVAETYGFLDRRIEETRAEYDRLDDAIRDLAATERTAERATQTLGDATKQAGEKVSETARVKGVLAQSTSALNMRIIAGTYAIQDFASAQGSLAQRIQSVSNNIPGIIGGFSAWGAALGATAAVGAVLIQNSDGIAKSLGLVGDAADQSKSKLEALKDKIKELEEKPHKLAVDLVDLENARKEVDRIQAALAAVEKLRNSRGVYERESGQQIDSMFAEAPGGGEGVRVDLRKQFIEEAKANSGELARARQRQSDLVKEATQTRAAAAGLEAAGSPGAATLRAKADALDAQAEKARQAAELATHKAIGTADTAMGDLLKRATEGRGPEQVEAQQQLAGRLRRAGRGELAAGVEASSPRSLEEQELTDNEFEAAIQKQSKGYAKQKVRKAFEFEVDQIYKDLEEAIRQGQRERSAKRNDENEKDAKKATDEAEKEQAERRKAYESKLGEGFIAEAERRRLAIEGNPNLSEADKRQERFRLQGQVQSAAYRRMVAGGEDPGKAAELSQGVNQFLQEDIQRQLNQLRSMGGVSSPWGGQPRTEDLVIELQRVMAQVIANQQMAAGNRARLQENTRRLERDAQRAGMAESNLNMGGPGS